jgi:hypothetical protein
MARAQFLAGKRSHVMHQTLGIPVVVLTAAVGTTIFATFGTNPDSRWVIIAGLVSLLAAILAALQTFLGYAQRAERHRAAAVAYSQLKRDLDLLVTQFGVTAPSATKALDALRPEIQRFAAIEKESGSVPDRYYDRARREERDDDEGV